VPRASGVCLGLLLLCLPACRTAAVSALPGSPVFRLQQDLSLVLASPALRNSSWGVDVRSLARHDSLFSSGAGKLLLPASAMKIVTLAAAAERLGWDYSYETRVLALGAIEGGVLDGDLMVVGSGDPSVDDWDGAASRLFREWADRLKALGVRSIRGRVVGDDNAFDDEGLGAGWAWDDLGASYATSLGALQFNQNTARLTIGAGPRAGDPAVVTAEPPVGSVSVLNLTTTGPPGSGLMLAALRRPGRAALELRGSIPVSSAPLVRNVSVDNPTLYFVSALRGALEENGIDVHGAAVDIDDIGNLDARGPAIPLLAHHSPPLASLATTLMKNSQNLYGETLLRTLGRGDGGAATAEQGRLAARATLTGWGIDPAAILMADGSGLSRYNLATAQALTTILEHVYSSERLRGPFLASLPVGGRDGTLERRLVGTRAEGRVQAKTGSFSNARALAGYVRSSEDEPIAFTIMANNFGDGADLVEQAIDAIVVRLAQFSRR
jgi:D-alanyl-D-alanine carboxypeptidase/D-alanyl-D-alanine-endopeptidase (penicillin-binding protein 4)